MMNSRTRARLAVTSAALALPVAFTLTACSSSGSTSAATAAPASSTAQAVSSAPAQAVKVPKYVAAANARKEITTSGCVQAGGNWKLKGSATNSTSSARSYSVVVDFVKTKGDTVVDTKVLTVGPVKPKATVSWAATGAAGAQNITCVIRQALAK
jgi:pectin methylesterase-like acyl-CoA thioesterase